MLEPFVYDVLFLVVQLKLGLGERLDAGLLGLLPLGKEGGLLDLVLVSLGDVVLDLLGLLLALELSNLLTLQVVLHLAFDQLALEHLLLKVLYEVKFEFVELIRDGLGVFHLLVVLFFKLLAHAKVVLLHLLLLELLPMLVDLFLNAGLAGLESFLGVLFVHDVAEQHLGLKSLDHVLSVVHVAVSFFNLLATQLVLEVLLLGVHFSSCDLI